MSQPKEIILANDTPGSPNTCGLLWRDEVMGRWWLLWGYSWLIDRQNSNKLWTFQVHGFSPALLLEPGSYQWYH